MKPEPITLEIRADNSDLLAKLAEAHRVMADFEASFTRIRRTLSTTTEEVEALAARLQELSENEPRAAEADE